MFRFQNGAIKRDKRQLFRMLTTYLSFDSKMVRLKERQDLYQTANVAVFRIQNGAIKRLYENRAYIIRYPYGTCQATFPIVI